MLTLKNLTITSRMRLRLRLLVWRRKMKNLIMRIEKLQTSHRQTWQRMGRLNHREKPRRSASKVWASGLVRARSRPNMRLVNRLSRLSHLRHSLPR